MSDLVFFLQFGCCVFWRYFCACLLLEVCILVLFLYLLCKKWLPYTYLAITNFLGLSISLPYSGVFRYNAASQLCNRLCNKHTFNENLKANLRPSVFVVNGSSQFKVSLLSLSISIIFSGLFSLSNISTTVSKELVISNLSRLFIFKKI